MTQAQMFPMTEEERIAILRGNLASDVEKRLAKRDAAAVALADAQEAEDGARGLLSVFDSMVRERDRAHAAAATAVDPITGEVASVVIALHPGSDEPVVTKIGEYTRYSELVADYSAAAGLGDGFEFHEWTVLAEDELTQEGGGRRMLSDVISHDDYGKRLLVVAADQGSVTGVAKEGSGGE